MNSSSKTTISPAQTVKTAETEVHFEYSPTLVEILQHQRLSILISTYQSGQAAVTKLRDLLATEPSVLERDDAMVLPPIDGRVEIDDEIKAGEKGPD